MKSLVCVFLVFFKISIGLAVDSGSDSEVKLSRVGGDYTIEAIDKVKDGFKIEFEAMQKTGSADKVVLFSDHVHFGLEVGAQIRISAEIINGNRSTVEAQQVLVFLPAPEGYLPVWLLSSKKKTFKRLKSGYLKMHAPQADYMVF